ncbi:ATP-binding protein [Brotaphodocola sp.]|uniref:ATP-binding protein n=1 Tax=Brotaphodocola sp. TaxID=3073577 RepID=UPI003D7DB978
MREKKQSEKNQRDAQIRNQEGQNQEKTSQKNRIQKITALLFGVAVLLVILIGKQSWNEYRDSIIDNQKKQLLLTVQGLRDSMEEFMASYVDDLEGLCILSEKNWDQEENLKERSEESPKENQKEDPQEDQQENQQEDQQENLQENQNGAQNKDFADWSCLQEYVDTHERRVVDVVAEDLDGNVIESVHGSEIETIYSKSQIDEYQTLIQAKLTNGNMELILQREIPEKGKLSLILNTERYFETMMEGLRVGKNGYVLLKDSKGVILLHPEREQWGIDAIQDREKLYPGLDLSSLQELINKQNRGEEGVDDYYSYWWMEPNQPRVRKICAYSPMYIGEDFLVLSAVMDYDEVYIPVAVGVVRLITIFVIFFGILIVMGIVLGGMFMQSKKDSERIAYLTELNGILEKMHQSEERIAHQQRLQIMGTMTGGIAHEFNNLLTPIMGYADLLMMDLPEDSESFSNAYEIYEASVKAKEIIQQISSLSRKNMETVYKNASADHVLRRALKMVTSVCPDNVTIETNLDVGEVCILCNETQMNQVILNICVNAIQAIGHREDGKLSVTARVADREALTEIVKDEIPETWERYVKVDISDNGCGMSDEVIRQIFDPFFTTKKGGKGTGLGLALVEQIIGSHKGYIQAESVPEQGSTFHIWLPINEQKEELAMPTQKNGDGQAKAGSAQIRILVIDDNAKVLQILKRDADRQNADLTGSMTFMQARQKLEEQTFDLLVVDQEVEGQSALDFCMAIQGQEPDLIKIVMADHVTKELIEARERGIIQAYLDKPVSVMEILNTSIRIRSEAEKGKGRI